MILTVLYLLLFVVDKQLQCAMIIAFKSMHPIENLYTSYNGNTLLNSSVVNVNEN